MKGMPLEAHMGTASIPIWGSKVETHANKHPACLHGALGCLDVDGFAMERDASKRASLGLRVGFLVE
eukprot:8603426-Pyramimonas_sp.AAC.1